MIPQTPPKRTTTNYVYGPGAPIGYQPPARLTNCVYGPGVPIGYQPGARPTNYVYGPGVPIGYQPGAPITNSCNQYRHETGCHKGSVKLTPEITKHLTQSGYSQEEINKLGNYLPACKALTPGAERKEADAALQTMVNRKLANQHSGITAKITGESTGKIISGNALGESFRNLVDSGLCDKDTAYRAHMAAAARIDDLFANAPKHEWQELYHEQSKRIDAVHLYSPFVVDGIKKPLTADISIIAFRGGDGRTLYSLGLRVKPPLPDSGI